MSKGPINPDQIMVGNDPVLAGHRDDYDSLGRHLSRRGISIDDITTQLAAFSLAIPSWGLGRGGTRFAKFAMPGEPTNIHEKLEDAAIVQQLCCITPRVSLHFPWDRVDDFVGLREAATSMGLEFDAVNSNTFQDQKDQAHSYQYGSLSAQDKGVRDQAIAHNIECIAAGTLLGSQALTVWVADGTNFPGQQDFSRSLDRYIDAAAEVYAALPSDWRMLLEHKLFEPAFYSSVISDWGSSALASQELGPKAQCLVDLGHHAPNVNIEQIVARLHRLGKLGGFHFNDSKYGDDDLDSGSINPHQLFLVFNELIEAQNNPRKGFNPAYMIDQSHNITDPIESMLSSAEAIATAFTKALLVDRAALLEAQACNDVMAAFQCLRLAYRTDVSPILAEARYKAGGALMPLNAYRSMQWRLLKSQHRKSVGLGAGIV